MNGTVKTTIVFVRAFVKNGMVIMSAIWLKRATLATCCTAMFGLVLFVAAAKAQTELNPGEADVPAAEKIYSPYVERTHIRSWSSLFHSWLAPLNLFVSNDRLTLHIVTVRHCSSGVPGSTRLTWEKATGFARRWSSSDLHRA